LGESTLLISARKSFLFSFPGVFLYSIFVVFPIFFGFYLSLTDIASFVQKLKFTGLQNYLTIFSEERFLNSLRVTIFYVITTSVLINVLALLIAICIDASPNRYLNAIARVLIYLPAILTPIIIGFIWYYIWKLGVPAVLKLIGLGSLVGSGFLGYDLAPFSVIVSTSWMNIGVAMLIYVSALLSVDSGLIAAASIDGAGSWRRLVSIKLPLITHAFIINFVNTLVFAFKQFDQIFSMTRGGPGYVTETMSIYIYRVAFLNGQVGRASAAAYVLFFMVMIVSLFIIVSLNRRAVQK
jgi:raffinose/stachyose/melibiose transport system permease protein